eukprot:49407-Eustigmatos_ZCMA.PRE.1
MHDLLDLLVASFEQELGSFILSDPHVQSATRPGDTEAWQARIYKEAVKLKLVADNLLFEDNNQEIRQALTRIQNKAIR